MNYFLITQDNVETIMNKVRRLTWDDANEVFSIIKDLKPVRITSDGKEDENQEELFKNKFSGTGDRNEKEKPKEDGESCKAEVECASGDCNEGICGPPKSKFTNNVPSSSPSAVNGEDEEDTNVAAKMEDAYNSMNQLLGDGAMKSMAKDLKSILATADESGLQLPTTSSALDVYAKAIEDGGMGEDDAVKVLNFMKTLKDVTSH